MKFALLFGLLLVQSTVDNKFLFVSDRIYTVLSVVLLIWAGILFLLFRMERKIDKLEKGRKN